MPENASNSPAQLWTRLRLVVMAMSAFRKALIKRDTLVSFDSDEALNDALATKLNETHLESDQDATPLDNPDVGNSDNASASSANRDDNLLISIETEATPSDVEGVTSVGGVNRQQPIAQGSSPNPFHLHLLFPKFQNFRMSFQRLHMQICIFY